MSNDAELLEAWRSGDAAAGEALFTRHYRSLKRFFRNKVSEERIADLIQETFIASVEGRDRIQDSSRFRGYLLRVAYHVFCRHVRELHRAGPQADLDEISLAGIDPTPSVVFGREEEQRLLLAGLRTISINYQVVLELHYWEDLSTNEIADILQVPPGTVRSRLQRARDALEAAMASIARSPQLLESTLTRLSDWASACQRELGGAASV